MNSTILPELVILRTFPNSDEFNLLTRGQPRVVPCTWPVKISIPSDPVGIRYWYEILWLSAISIYSLSDLGVSSNLIGSLSRSNWALFTRCEVNNAWSKQNKMAGVNSRFATISEAEILKTQEDAVPKKATKSVVEITEWVYTKTIILFNLDTISKNNC